jgi:hypothetical protein
MSSRDHRSRVSIWEGVTTWTPEGLPPTFGELAFRDCPWCHVSLVQMRPVMNSTLQAASGDARGWVVLACPRCAGLTALELTSADTAMAPGHAFNEQTRVGIVQQVPENEQRLHRIEHLPADVERHLDSAMIIFTVGQQDAAAVELRRTLEAAAAHKRHRRQGALNGCDRAVDRSRRCDQGLRRCTALCAADRQPGCASH